MSILVGLVFGVIFSAILLLMNGRRIFIPIFFAANILYSWLTLPTLQYGFTDIPKILLINSAALMGLIYLNSQSMTARKIRVSPAFASLGVAFIALFVIPFLTSFSGFHAQKYYALAGDIVVGKFSKDVSAIDMSQVRRVDARLARNVAEKRLGEDRGLGSRVNVGPMSIQKVNGNLYWVGPLVHSKFRRWLDNKSGTPGYVMVSASNENQVELVTEASGKPLSIRYNSGAYFSDNPKRHVYDHGYATKGLTDWTFEIDDEGQPHYVITDYVKKIGFDGEDAVGILILDTQTGAIKSYRIDDAPAWVDRIQPDAIIDAQLTNWGRFKKGWVNSWLGADGVLKTTEGMSLVYGNDGASYFYTGMQSVGSDEGTVGFVLINTRDKAMRFYEQAGATEMAAKNSAEDEFQDFGYQATNPILYNIGGVPTYFMTLKASSGLVKAAAFVSVEDYSLVGTGKTTEAALRNYNQALRGRGNSIALNDAVDYQTANGRVLRLRQEIVGQSITYYVMIEGHPAKVFAVPSDLTPTVRMTQTGDALTMSYEDSGNGVIDVVQFENAEISLQRSETQINIDERQEMSTP